MAGRRFQEGEKGIVIVRESKNHETRYIPMNSFVWGGFICTSKANRGQQALSDSILQREGKASQGHLERLPGVL